MQTWRGFQTNVEDVSECGEGYTGVLHTSLFFRFQKGQNRSLGEYPYLKGEGVPSALELAI